MQAVVKTRHIDIKIRGRNIPTKLIYALKDEYGDKVKITDDDDALVNILETPWYKDLKEKTTPGDTVRIYRQAKGWTQEKLGELLGDIPRQHISNMEHGKRPISSNTARKLAKLFNVPMDRFISDRSLN